MIGWLSGRILHRAMDHVMLDVRGVGYVVHVSSRTAGALPPVGQVAALYTELLVREDLLQLFGFPTLYEKEWHRLLTGVQGVGAKASLSILGTLGPEGLGRALALGDWSALRKSPGVGPKLAQRIVMELKDKAPSVMALGGTLSVDPAVGAPADPGELIEPPAPVTPAPAPADAGDTAEAMSALTNLGYGGSEAARAVAQAGAEGAQGTAALIRAALRLLAPRD